MIVDAHCHAWPRWPYVADVPHPDFADIESLLHTMDRHGVERATVVCARIGPGTTNGRGAPNHDNNDYVAAFARRHPDRISALVDVDSYWSPEHHAPGATGRLLREVERTGATGFSHYFSGPNDGWLASDEGAAFFAAAADAHLLASLSIGAAWFADLRAIARANPTLPILIHHMSVPHRSAEGYREADVAELLACAAEPNIGVKISGFNYNSARAWDYPYADSRELFRRIHAAFGPDRLYWGSDFPVSTEEMLTYRQALEVVRTHCDFLTPADLDLVLGGNLQRLLTSPVLPARASLG